MGIKLASFTEFRKRLRCFTQRKSFAAARSNRSPGIDKSRGPLSVAGTFQEIEPGKRIVFTWGWESATDLPGDHFLGRLVAEASSDSGAGPDEWSAAPDPIDHLIAADASLAVLLGVLRKLTPEDREKPTPWRWHGSWRTRTCSHQLWDAITGLCPVLSSTRLRSGGEGGVVNN